MKKLSAQHLAILAFCLMLGLCMKKIISPFSNVLTDFIRIPGGSASTGFSLAFLVLGSGCVPVSGAGTLMGFTQGLLALCLGMSGYQGILCVVTYTIPGLIIDLCGKVFRKRHLSYFLVTCSLSNLVSAAISNLLIFHLAKIAGILWLLVSVCSGIAGGFLAAMLYERIVKIIPDERWVLN